MHTKPPSTTKKNPGRYTLIRTPPEIKHGLFTCLFSSPRGQAKLPEVQNRLFKVEFKILPHGF